MYVLIGCMDSMRNELDLRRALCVSVNQDKLIEWWDAQPKVNGYTSIDGTAWDYFIIEKILLLA